MMAGTGIHRQMSIPVSQMYHTPLLVTDQNRPLLHGRIRPFLTEFIRLNDDGSFQARTTRK